MSRNPSFDKTLARMQDIHDKKNEDYAETSNPYSNFEGAAKVAGTSVDKVFQVLLGIKMERLRQLVDTEKRPNNESIDDTILDLANYAALWHSYQSYRWSLIPTEKYGVHYGPGR